MSYTLSPGNYLIPFAEISGLKLLGWRFAKGISASGRKLNLAAYGGEVEGGSTKSHFSSLKRAGTIAILMFLAAGYYGMLVKEKDAEDDKQPFNYYLMKAFYYENKKEYSAAKNEADLAYDQAPYNPRVVFRQGVLFYKMNNFGMAEKKFKDVIGSSSYAVIIDAYYNLGLIYNTQGRFDEAREMLVKALDLDPLNLEANFELGVTYKAKGLYKEAGEKFNLVLKSLGRCRTSDRLMVEKELRDLHK